MHPLQYAMFAISAFGLATYSHAQEVEWRQSYASDFESDRLSADVYRVSEGRIQIVDGHAHIEGRAASLLINVVLGRDVRTEFDLKLPDLPHQGTLLCRLEATSNAHYDFTLDLDSGQARIHALDLDETRGGPPLKLTPGAWHRVVMIREGRRFAVSIDGQEVIASDVPRIRGAAGFSRLRISTDKRGFDLDNVAFAHRSPPHPDCCPPDTSWWPLTREQGRVRATGTMPAPGLNDLVEALNAKRFDDAKKLLAGMNDPVLRLAGRAYLLGDLDYFEKPIYGNLTDRERTEYTDEELGRYFGEFGAFMADWRAEMTRRPDDAFLKEYWPMAERAGRMVLNRWYIRKYILDLVETDQRVNPFFDKARLCAARFDYWNGAEGGKPELKAKAMGVMRELLALYPDNRVLREYVGPPVPWGDEFIADTDHHPAWAAYLREAYARELAVMERFCDMRQYPDGQFGGGWGDDVEMLRKWVAIGSISSCAGKVRGGIEKLAEGVWEHDLLDGYDDRIGDVEHSAEPSADSQPTMMLIRHGDPLWYERNLRGAKTIRERFMGLDQRGFPRFKSVFFGSLGVNVDFGRGGDTGYHARAMKHFLWLAWAGNREARDYYLHWLDGWREMALLDAPDKPAGILPGTLWWPSGSYQPPDGSKWYLDGPGKIYGAWGLPAMLQESFLAAYGLSGDDKWLKPMGLLMDWATIGPLDKDSDHDQNMKPGTREWFRLPMAHCADARLTSLYRHYTGERVYDEYTRRFGTPTQVYQIDHDLDGYMKSIQKAAESLRNNLWFFTTEVQSTDRLHLPAVESVFGAYTGGVVTTGDCDPQTFAVTYDTPSTDFAALVVDNTPRRLRVWIYGFWDEPTPINLRVWQLEPGSYIMNQGELMKGEFPFQHRYGWQEPSMVSVTHRAEAIPLTLPPGKVWVVDLRLDEPLDVPADAPDLAVMPRDLQIRGSRLTATIHNIGNAAATDIPVALQHHQADGWKTIGTQRISNLPPSTNLELSTEEVSFDLSPGVELKRCRVIIDPDDAAYELCETNNVAAVLSPK